jgi:hypothetical protein
MGSVSAGEHPFQILVIQPWTTDLEAIECSLRSAGIDAAITRVDFEAALNAALTHQRFDVIVFDGTTPELSRELIAACLRANGREAPLVMLDDVKTLGMRVATILEKRRS